MRARGQLKSFVERNGDQHERLAPATNYDRVLRGGGSAARINRRQGIIAVILAAIAVTAALLTAWSLGIVGRTSFAAVAQPKTQLALNFANAGQVVEIDVRPGQRVKVGQVLARQNQAPVLDELAATRSDLAAVTAEQLALQSGSPRALVQFVAVQLQNAQQQLAVAQRQATDLRSQATLVVQVSHLQVQSANQNLAADQQSSASQCGGSASSSAYCQTLQRDIRIDKQQVSIANAELARAEAQGASLNDQALQGINAKQLALSAAQAQQGSPNTAISPTVVQSDIQVALARAQADQAKVQQELNAMTLTAPVAGVVTAVNGTVGQVAGSQGVAQYSGQASVGAQTNPLQLVPSVSGGSSAGGPVASPLVQLIDSSGWQAIAQVSENDVHSLRVGERATVTFGALPSKQMHGVLQSIVLVPERGSSGVFYPAIFTLSGDPSGLDPGMSASVAPGG